MHYVSLLYISIFLFFMDTLYCKENFLRHKNKNTMSPSLDWHRERGERLRNGRMRIYCWHYDKWMKYTIYWGPVLARYSPYIISLFFKTALPRRFDKPHFIDAQVQGDQVTCARSLSCCGLGGNFQSGQV